MLGAALVQSHVDACCTRSLHAPVLLPQPTIYNGDRCGASCDFWNRYEEDLERAAALGSNCFRISLEWHRIEPARGQVDMEAVQRYNKIFDCMHRWAIGGT